MDIERARFNMVEQQIRPWDVLDQDVLDLLYRLRREEFVPPTWRTLAFTDMEIPLTLDSGATGEVMLAPKVEARMLQAVAPRRHETVLEIGAGSGYMAALLAHFARRVITCDIHAELVRFASGNLARSGVSNVSVELRHGLRAAPGANFDVIVLSGSVPFVPEDLLDRLVDGGRLVAIVGEPPMMTAQLITRLAGREFAAENLFDTVTAPLREFPQKETFAV
ncbi:MAG: protein-L-isoaspartate O-methyltransferase [Burkholderiaceae bacterium]|nr:protein-L-isoaspartate O-methyltransferase [Burkholderiaceae bacterium]